MAEILRDCAILGWAAEHFDNDSQNLAGIILHNSVLSVIGQDTYHHIVLVAEVVHVEPA